MIGGGLAGLSSAVALAESGFRVRVLERRPFLGGRAASYVLPGGEHVDNCQHVTLGCCTNLDDFYRRAGAGGKIATYDRLVFVDREGRRGIMQASALPAPFHLTASLPFYPSLSWNDLVAIGRAMLAIALRGGRNGGGDAAGKSMLEWLRLHGQSEDAIRRFWAIVLVSALNEQLDRIDARYGLDVFWKAFLANRAGYRLGIPRVPLGELYDGCRAAIERRGGEVSLRSPVRRLRMADDRVAAVEMDGGYEETADLYVLAVPQNAIGELLPEQWIARQPALSNLGKFRVSPITGVHLWFDRDVMSEPFLILLDRTTQWIFNKSRLYGISGDGSYLQLVISASYDLVPRSRQEIVDMCLAEVREVLPEAGAAKLLKSTVVKETFATFSPEPGSELWRPPQRSDVPNLYFAGDWTATGWPATMEGAVRSGYLAAEAVLADAGIAGQFLQPDLPPEGIGAWFAAPPELGDAQAGVATNDETSMRQKFAAAVAAGPVLGPFPGWVLGAGEKKGINARLRREVWRSLRKPFEVQWLEGLRLGVFPGNEMSQAIFITGCYEPNEFNWLARILQPGMTFVDVGANMGLYSLFAARRVGSQGCVLAFEPSGREYAMAKANIERNQLSQVKLMRMALSDETGNVELLVAPMRHSGHNTLGAFAYNTPIERRETVPAERLDDVLLRMAPHRVDVIKMDVEGAELRVLRGAAQTLARFRPVLLVEVSERSLQHQGSSGAELLQLFAQQGYDHYRFDKQTGFPVMLDAQPLAESENVVCVPSGTQLWKGGED